VGVVQPSFRWGGEREDGHVLSRGGILLDEMIAMMTLLVMVTLLHGTAGQHLGKLRGQLLPEMLLVQRSI
jgi:hypothetical protein